MERREEELSWIVINGADFRCMHEIATLHSMKEMKDVCIGHSNMNDFGQKTFNHL